MGLTKDGVMAGKDAQEIMIDTYLFVSVVLPIRNEDIYIAHMQSDFGGQVSVTFVVNTP